MEPTYYIQLVRRRWRLVVAITLIGAALGFLSTLVVSTEKQERDFYAATHTLLGEAPPSAQGPGQPREDFNYEQLVFFSRLGQVPDRVAEEVGGDPIELASRVAVTPLPAGDLVEVTATGRDPAAVEELADVYAAILVQFVTERDQADRQARIEELTAEVTQLEAQYAETQAELDAGGDPALLDARLDALTTQLAPAQTELTSLETAGPVVAPFSTLQSAQAIKIGPEAYAAQLAESAAQDKDVISARDAQIAAAQSATSSSDSPVIRTGVGGVIGLIVAVVALLVLDRVDPRLRSKEEVESAFGLPLLTEIPAFSRAQATTDNIVSHAQPRSRIAESFRLLRSALLFAWVNATEPESNGNGHGNGQGAPKSDDPMVILVSSPGPSEGKTTVTSNLAVVFAEAGYRVLALNCDYRRPRLHEYLGVSYEPRRVLPTEIENVYAVADVVENADRTNPAEVVAAQRKTIEQGRAMFDVIIVDTAPLLTTGDAAEILDIADMVVMVARSGRTTHDAAFRSGELLDRREANAVGTVLVAAESRGAARYYYYYRGRYYHDDREAPDAGPTDERAEPDRNERAGVAWPGDLAGGD